MNIVLLSGGSGKRLWPLSNDTQSKQFLKLLKNDRGEPESMVQRVMRQIREAWPDAFVIVTCNEAHKDILARQLGNVAEYVAEPSRRDTFPAIAYAAAWLHSEKGLPLDERIVVCPIDVFAEKEYFELLSEVEALADMHSIGLMGALPTYPSVKYGYIVGERGKDASLVEKPTEDKAGRLIEKGAHWNCGVFGVKLGYVLEKAAKYVPNVDFRNLAQNYGKLPAVSFDYEVVEKEASIGFTVYRGAWKDLGTWNTLTEEMGRETVGTGVLVAENSKNTHVLNMLNIPVIVQDASDLVVVASYDGILVTSKQGSSFIKPLADRISSEPMYAQCEWGNYRVLDKSEHLSVKLMKIDAGKTMECGECLSGSHVWVVARGRGILSNGGKETAVNSGCSIVLRCEEKVSLLAATEMEVAEIHIYIE